MKNINISLELFLMFIKEAKQNSFAKNLSKKPMRRNGSRKYIYKKGVWFYQDYYLGSFVDGGMELVKVEKHPVWMMGYKGGIINTNFSKYSKDIFNFLKQALILCPKEFPVRGPEEYSHGSFLYKNEISGSILDFYGKELILLENKAIYEKKYIGGMLQGKVNNILLNN